MNPLKKKMVLAPILAVTFVFLLAGTVGFIPQNTLETSPTPQHTSNPNSTAIPAPTTAAMSAAAADGVFLSGLFAVIAIVIIIIVARLFFSEKSINKEINQ